MKTGTLRWLYAVPGRKKLYILALMAAQACYGVSGVLYALLLRRIVDTASAGDRAGFWRFLLLTGLLVLAQLALRALIRWMNEKTKSVLENAFKSRLTDTLLRRDYLAVSAVHSGEWMNRLTSDTVVVADGYTEILPGLAGMAAKIVSALAIIIALEPLFALVLIPGGAAFLLLTWVFRKKLKRLHRAVQEADGRLRVFLQERIGNLLMIHSYAAEEDTRTDAGDRMQAHQRARMRKNRVSNLGNVGFGMAMSGMYLLGVGWCGYGILKGTITFGTLTAITHLISQLQAPLAGVTGYVPKFYAMLASADRLREAEDFETDDEPACSAEEMEELYCSDLRAVGLEDVTFAYYPPCDSPDELSKDRMPAALNRLSVEIRKGEYVAFTGHSGCGKSTVLKILMCVYRPDDGVRYYVDGSGRRQSLTSSYRRLFAYVPQGNRLMSGTVRDVVSFAAGEAAKDGERLERALRISCADEFVSALPDGPDTLLGEGGTGLSEGQMQRLAIARAVFSESPILLLDEVTSALDEATEQRVLKNLREMTDRTVVIVTHRPAALEICDRVLEFTENGVMER
ncbi:MAG: ABC transporter ATP-binding protein [Oscillospiraceae bacterium]|nr:ABC transporter ATP-binding protein [Oscillospiraceae bacterium]